ncbi:hypothetical protein [Methylobacterium platani]|uniref:Uncharacterized protein n=2 Tax=Methylobacterium platani TaxID=427683 RepID=A0A179S8A8_9HYPH|nr:hypothetical protein [Methylobacterium platani]KMO10598.1 hypothetical protein SQ03_29725 [Methylobacterium platani JCM 14648]OAS23945.1 hypothetical protein A5481_15985 [Methylobacterium platani]
MPAVALALVAAPPADPSPPPDCVSHDRSGGYRAHVTLHALRRFADRVMGLEPVLEGLSDREAVEAVTGLGYDVPGIRAWLAYYGYPGPRYGARGVVVGRVGLVLQGPRVVTVVMRGA